MARSSSLRVQKTSRFLRFFPDSWQDYLSERVHDSKALIITFAGAFLLFSLLTYDAGDPSLNTVAGGDDVQNWMGVAGAYLADILVQIFGVGSLVLAFGLIAWGWRMWRKEDFGPLWGRMVALLAAALLLGIAGGAISGGGWISHATMGGAGGILLLNKLTGLISGFVSFYPHLLVAGVSGLVGLVLAAIGMALRRSERQAVVETFLSGGAATIGGASSIWGRFQEWRDSLKEQNEFEEDDEEESEEDDSSEDDDDEEYDESDEEEEQNEDDESEIEVIRPQKKSEKSQKSKSSKQTKLNLRDPSEWDLPPHQRAVRDRCRNWHPPVPERSDDNQ